MVYDPYTQTTENKLHEYLTEEEILVMSNLADIAFEDIITQDPELDSVYDIVLDIQNPEYKEIIQEYVERHREYVNEEIDFDEDTTDTENYFRHLMHESSYPNGAILIGTDNSVAETYDETKTRFGIEPNAVSLLVAVTQQ